MWQKPHLLHIDLIPRKDYLYYFSLKCLPIHSLDAERLITEIQNSVKSNSHRCFPPLHTKGIFTVTFYKQRFTRMHGFTLAIKFSLQGYDI